MNAIPNVDAFLASLDPNALAYLRKAVAAPKPKRKGKGYFKTTVRVVFADGAEYRLSVLATDPQGSGAIEQAKRTATAIHTLALSEKCEPLTFTLQDMFKGNIENYAGVRRTHVAGRWEWRNDGPGGSQRLRLVGIDCPAVVSAAIES